MSKQMVTTRLPWQDRWTEPTVEQLLKPLDRAQRDGLAKLINLLAEFDGIDYELVWYGEAWKWTLHYGRRGQGRNNPGIIQTMCYLVPKHEQSLVCIPMTSEMIDDLPVRRLTKFIREGIKTAKCAVENHWAHWTPTSASEFNSLVDLLRRKHNFMTMHTTSLAKTPKKD